MDLVGIMLVLLWCTVGYESAKAASSRRGMKAIGLLLLASATTHAYLTGGDDSSLLGFVGAMLTGRCLALLLDVGARVSACASVCALLLIVASSCAFAVGDAAGPYKYMGITRRVGLLGDPNQLGLCCAVSLILCVGLLAALWSSVRASEKLSTQAIVSMSALFLVALLLCRALVETYSRSGWMLAAIGSSYSWKALSGRSDRGRVAPVQAAAPSWRVGMMAAVASGCVAYGAVHMGDTDNAALRRLLSVLNPNDLSWLNRAYAWQAAIPMVWETPLLGHGADVAAELANQWYAPMALATTSAVETNDYLRVAVWMGPTWVLGFTIYVGHCLCGWKGECLVHLPTPLNATLGGIVSAGAIQRLSAIAAAVVACGAVFNSVLFTYATASMLWVSLEMACQRPGGGR